MRDRPTLAIQQIGIISVVVGRPKRIFIVVTAHSHPSIMQHHPHPPLHPTARSGAWISATICANICMYAA
jgi:hypothetical protein